MSASSISVGDIVRAGYKSGEYIGKIVEIRSNKAVVQVLAVVKHPMQGDLHRPGQADVAIFHQRRALAHNEKARISLSAIRSFEGDVPDYKQSLETALETQMAELKASDQNEYTERSLAELEQLKSEY